MKPHRLMPRRQSHQTMDDITGKFDAISMSSGKPESLMAGQPPASGASAWGSDFVIRRGQHDRYHPPAPQSSSGSIQPSSEGEADGEVKRLKSVGRKKDFNHMERVGGRLINVLQGLELHTNVFNSKDQKKIVDCVYDLQDKGRKGQLRERTYSEPNKWMRGKGRVTIQFGCCYNYAVDKYGNPPGIIRDEHVDLLPPLLKSMIKRMVAWHVLPPTCIPNSCIINIYDKDDCIPPHIDHHDFVRPFCTVSFLSECKIVFGTELKILGPGDFSGSVAIPLPLGSVLILNGNGADVAKHCVPAVPAKRISITFRKMDDSKSPFKFVPDPELQNLQHLANGSHAPHRTPPPHFQEVHDSRSSRDQKGHPETVLEKRGSSFQMEQHDFPPLGSNSRVPKGKST